jgi:hypothetical protein
MKISMPRKLRLGGILGLDVVDLFGSSGRTRTYNPSVNSRMLVLVRLGEAFPWCFWQTAMTVRLAERPARIQD